MPKKLTSSSKRSPLSPPNSGLYGLIGIGRERTVGFCRKFKGGTTFFIFGIAVGFGIA